MARRHNPLNGQWMQNSFTGWFLAPHGASDEVRWAATLDFLDDKEGKQGKQVIWYKEGEMPIDCTGKLKVPDEA